MRLKIGLVESMGEVCMCDGESRFVPYYCLIQKCEKKDIASAGFHEPESWGVCNILARILARISKDWKEFRIQEEGMSWVVTGTWWSERAYMWSNIGSHPERLEGHPKNVERVWREAGNVSLTQEPNCSVSIKNISNNNVYMEHILFISRAIDVERKARE